MWAWHPAFGRITAEVNPTAADMLFGFTGRAATRPGEKRRNAGFPRRVATRLLWSLLAVVSWNY